MSGAAVAANFYRLLPKLSSKFFSPVPKRYPQVDSCAAMASSECIYRRTVAGQSAWESGAPLAAPLLRVLNLVEAEMHSHILRRLLRHHPDDTVTDWISQLEKLGLLEVVPTPLEHDLDFTGSFALQK